MFMLVFLCIFSKRDQNRPPRTYALYLRADTAPHKQPWPAILTDAHGGVYADVWCASKQSQAARRDSRDVSVSRTFEPAAPKATEVTKILQFTHEGLIQ